MSKRKYSDLINDSNLDQFENDILYSLKHNNISNAEIMQAYTFIHNNKNNKEICFQFRNIYQNVINFLLEQIVIKFDEDSSIFRRRIQLQLHKYHMKKKTIDKMFFNFKDCFYNKCLSSTMGTISEIHDNLLTIKFQNVSDYVIKYDSKKIKEYIKNCKNSLILKSKLIDSSNEFFKRNIFCYF